MYFLPQSYHFYKTYIAPKAHQKVHLFLLDLKCWSLNCCWNVIKKLSWFHLRIQLPCKAIPGLGLVSILADIFREVQKTLRVDASWKKKNIHVGKISVALYLSSLRALRFKVQFSWYGFSVVLRCSCRSPWIGYIYTKVSQILLMTKQKRFLASFDFILLSFIVSEPI